MSETTVEKVIIVKNAKSKGLAALLALLLGGIGIHKFYLGNAGAGVIYLLLFWTFIPSIIAFFEGIGLAFMSNEKFDNKFNKC